MIARDKIEHLIAGFVIAINIGLLFTPLVGLIVGVVAGAAKEIIWDWWLGKGTPEWLDFIATVIGALIAFGLLLVAM